MYLDIYVSPAFKTVLKNDNEYFKLFYKLYFLFLCLHVAVCFSTCSRQTVANKLTLVGLIKLSEYETSV